MLSERTIEILSTVVKHSTRMKAALFHWDSARRRLLVTTSWRQKMYFIITGFYLLCEAIYQGCTLYWASSHTRVMSAESYMKLVAHFVTRLCGLLLTLVNGYNSNSIATFFNQLLQMNQRFNAYVHNRKFIGKSDRALVVIGYVILLQPLIPAFTYLNEYEDKRYWQGAVLPRLVLPFIRPAFFVVEYWISSYVVVGAYFVMYAICSHCCSVATWVTTLSLKQKYVNVREWQRYRVRNGACILFKGLQILNQSYNSCYANTTGVGLAACMGCLSITLALSIKLSPHVNFPGCLLFPIGAINLIQVPRCAFASTVEVTESSMAFVENYGCTRNRLQAKTARALRPLFIRVSVFSEMTRSTMIEFYSQVIDNTVSLLLM